MHNLRKKKKANNSVRLFKSKDLKLPRKSESWNVTCDSAFFLFLLGGGRGGHVAPSFFGLPFFFLLEKQKQK